MILTLAMRNLFHDRIRLVVTLVGILFSIVLVAVQLGLYLGAKRMIVDMIDNARGELWITTFGAKSFEEGGIILTPKERHAALATPGVKAVVPLVVTFAEWRKPGGGSTNSVLVGTNQEDGGLAPWNIIEGDASSIEAPDAVLVDKSYLQDLGINGVGDTAQIETGRVRVRGLTAFVRSRWRPTFSPPQIEHAHCWEYPARTAPSFWCNWSLVPMSKRYAVN
jgi:putative ABC transport system permease protein